MPTQYLRPVDNRTKIAVPNYYQFTVLTSYLEPLAVIGDYIGFTYNKTLNNYGTLVHTQQYKYKSLFLNGGRLIPDRIIRIDRSVAGGPFAIEFNTLYFCRQVEWDYEKITITAVDADILLQRRVLAYTAKSSQTNKFGHADDLMKAYVRENLGNLASDATRKIPTNLFSVQPDQGFCPYVNKSASGKTVLSTLQDLALDSQTRGTWLGFGIIAMDNGSRLEFQTFRGQRGTDRRYPIGDKPMILGAEQGNLTNVQITDDWRDEKNVVYAGGIGTANLQIVRYAQNLTRRTISPWSRCEEWVSASHTDTTATVQTEADLRLRELKPVKSFSADVQDTDVYRYGREYYFGDRVTAIFDGEGFDCMVEGVQVDVTDPNPDTVTIKLQSPIELYGEGDWPEPAQPVGDPGGPSSPIPTTDPTPTDPTPNPDPYPTGDPGDPATPCTCPDGYHTDDTSTCDNNCICMRCWKGGPPPGPPAPCPALPGSQRIELGRGPIDPTTGEPLNLACLTWGSMSPTVGYTLATALDPDMRGNFHAILYRHDRMALRGDGTIDWSDVVALHYATVLDTWVFDYGGPHYVGDYYDPYVALSPTHTDGLDSSSQMVLRFDGSVGFEVKGWYIHPVSVEYPYRVPDWTTW
jgi:hypothetical protein